MRIMGRSALMPPNYSLKPTAVCCRQDRAPICGALTSVLAMSEQLSEYWYVIAAILGAVGLLRWQARQRGGDDSLGSSFRKNIDRHSDPKSALYDPGLFGRQLMILMIGLPLIAITLLVVWLVQN